MDLYFAVDSRNEWLLSFTLHQGTKTPGFDPVNEAQQIMLFKAEAKRILAQRGHSIFKQVELNNVSKF